MNVFKALSEGHGRISETNITSFISYLLNSRNELKNSFFILFALLVDSELSENKICDLLNIKQKSIRERILYFSNEYFVSSEPEHRIKKDGEQQFQIPDVFVRIYSRDKEKIKAFLLIENKIKKGSKTQGQLEKQLIYFKNSGDGDDYEENIPVYSIFITPDEESFRSSYESARKENSNTIWLKWVNHAESDKSIEAKLRELVKHEQNAEIEPIDPNTQFIIKSFVDYLATEFSEKERGKMGFSVNGFDVVEQAEVIVENLSFTIKMYENNMIRLFDADDNMLNTKVKPFLRRINEEYNLEIGLESKNTQILGKEIIIALNKKNGT
jgi:hypothetical protein